ncbi:MAG: vitamin K epoxide reductase family protein [Waddliaceae bacterium]
MSLKFLRPAIVFLGLWLIATALSLGNPHDPLMASDMISGLLLMFFACIWRKQGPSWAIAIVGLWLQLAPLVFWAYYPFLYLNDTLIGVAVLFLSVVVPTNPAEERFTQEPIPPGWSYNPSSFYQRLPIVFLSFFAWMFSRYMAFYQLGYTGTVWDPVFGVGTEKVITSAISQKFPVADAGLGACAYTLEMIMAVHGAERRWYAIPWFVLVFAFLVIPVGLVSTILIVLQPVAVGYFCFWCLLTACCMLGMMALSVDEAVAVIQQLQWIYRNDRENFWSGFWRGHSPLEGAEHKAKSAGPLREMFLGVSPTWTLILCVIAGFWFAFSTKWFALEGLTADLYYIIAPFSILLSVVSFAEVTRSLRWLNVILGAAIILISLISPQKSFVGDMIAGIILLVFSIPKGRITNTYGSWNTKIF